LERVLRSLTLTASRWESPTKQKKDRWRRPHFGWEKETPHAKTLSPQDVHFLPAARLMALCWCRWPPFEISKPELAHDSAAWKTLWPFTRWKKGPAHIAASQASPRHVPSSLDTCGVALALQWILLLKCWKLCKLQVQILNMVKKLGVV
jgi:hypothetical protein